MSDLLSVEEARRRLIESLKPVGVEIVPLVSAYGRVLAEEAVSPHDIPPFSNSAMDGFAVCVEDLVGASKETPVTLQVIADIPAGTAPVDSVNPGQAARIMTGAQIPGGAEAVVPVEDTDFQYRFAGKPAPESVQVYRPVRAGANIRPKGEDLLAGEQVLPPGFRLRPQDTALLAMLGIPNVKVYLKPRVALLSTGDELITVEEPLRPGKIYDSNGYMLSGLVEKFGGEPVNLGIARDTAGDVEERLDKAAEAGVDLIVSTAGVSVGAYDYVRDVVEKGGKIDFWRVNMRPGKPLAFGNYRGVPFIGLPGNPVSAFVGFQVFVRPALRKMGGVQDEEIHFQKIELSESIVSDGRETYVRAIVFTENRRELVKPVGHQGSGNLHALTRANALLIIPSGVKSLAAGTRVDTWLFDW